MKFCLTINASDSWRESVQSALSLVTCMTSNGHHVNAVFFYGQAVKVIQDSALLRQWQAWQRKQSTVLLLCSTLIEQHQLSTIAEQTDAFDVVSLGSWVQAIENADKAVELS